MDRYITATEANQRFSEMLREVAEGESFVVTSRGKPLARVSRHGLDRSKSDFGELFAYLDTLPKTKAHAWTRESLYD